MTAAGSTERFGGPAPLNRGARATRAKRSLAEFVRQAVDAGEVEGIRDLEWGPHLDALCSQTQLQLEAWLVAYPVYGLATPEMIERQREAWERERPVIVRDPDGNERTEMQRATWEDGAPRPWERYVLVQNMLVNLPPGTFKSTIVMVLGNAWIWLWCPWFAFAASSGIDANVKRDSDATRALVKSAWYRETFAIAWIDLDVDPDLDEIDEDTGIKIRHDASSVSDWKTTAGGRRISRTIGRGFTGAHADGLFLDDPDDADKVWNEAARLKPQNRFARAMRNRVNCDHRSIRNVEQQVVHPLGFSAYLLSLSRWSPSNPKGWARLCIAAEFGYGPDDAPVETPYGWRDWRREKGEVIHRRLSAGVLADYRANTPNFAGQYNQNPDEQADGILARRHARFFVFDTECDRIESMRRRPIGCPSREEQPPVVVRLAELRKRALSVDAANSIAPDQGPNSKASAVGLTVNAMRGAEETFVLDDRTQVLGVSGTYRAIYAAIAAWDLDTILVELAAMGPSVVAAVREALRRGWYMDPITDEKTLLLGPDGKPARCTVETRTLGKDSKLTRNQGLVQPWQDGLIFAHDGAAWLHAQADVNRRIVDEGFIGEVCSYPGSRRSDRMDSLSQYVAHNRRVVQPPSSGAPIVVTRVN